MTYTYAMQYGPEDMSGKMGRPIPSTAVSVYLTGTNSLATLYTSVAKGTTAANPTATDVLGNLTFFVDPGQYDIVMESTRYTITLPLNPLEIVSGGGAVSSVYGRIGAVVATTGDYTAAQVGAAPVFNVKSTTYGAVGNGTSDDTTAIQAAINAANIAGGGIVYFPPGTYLISNSLTMYAGITLRGVNQFIAWGLPTNGSVIVCASSMSNPLVSVGAGINYWAIEGLSFSTTGGTTSALVLQVAGSSGSNSSDWRLARVTATNLGGIGLTYATRFSMEDVVVGTWSGSYGISMTHCTIAFLNRCNAGAPSSPGSGGGSFQYNYYAQNCGTINMQACESNGSPNYCLYWDTVVDSEAWNFECNGAFLDMMYFTGCGDCEFDQTYILQPSNNGVHIFQSSNMRFKGGWVLQSSGSSGSAFYIDGSSGGAWNINISGMLLGVNSSSTQPVISIVNNVFDVVINGNIINPASSSYAGISDQSSNGSRHAAYVGNIIKPSGANAITYTASASLVIADNSGFPNLGFLALKTITGTYAALTSDAIILANAASGAFTITLPTAAGVGGKPYTIKKIDSSQNGVTVATTSSQTIDGITTDLIATPLESDTYISDGSNWWKA